MDFSGPNETGIRVIPPFLFLAALIVAWGLEVLIPTSTGLPAATAFVGWAVVVACGAFVIYLYLDFRRAGIDYDVRKRPTGLVTSGAFAFSRNPGYLAMAVATAAFALVFDSLWALPAALAGAVATRFLVIDREEALLEELFGDDYRAYKARVRRWI